MSRTDALGLYRPQSVHGSQDPVDRGRNPANGTPRHSIPAEHCLSEVQGRGDDRRPTTSSPCRDHHDAGLFPGRAITVVKTLWLGALLIISGCAGPLFVHISLPADVPVGGRQALGPMYVRTFAPEACRGGYPHWPDPCYIPPSSPWYRPF